MAIEPTQNLPIRLGETEPRPASEVEAGSTVDFGSVLAEGLSHANKLDAAASAKVEALVKGASDDLHGTMISAKEAEIAVKLVGSVRNRLLDAFHELWRIQL
jgi:flagellar hook-basal body complex protein FliE